MKVRKPSRRIKLTDYICDVCREAFDKDKAHPGHMHIPGICDCPCRDE